MMDKLQEKEALKALLMSLMKEDSEEEEAGPYVEERRETSVSPEEVEGELYDEDQGVSEDANEEEDEDEEGEEEGELSLKDLVAAFMNEKSDPFAEKKGMPMGGGRSLEIEMKSEKPVMAAILGKKKKRGR